MISFLDGLAQQRAGVLLLLLAIIVLAFLSNFVVWMLGLGRYKKSSQEADYKLRRLVMDFIFKLIDDFRHLLALVMVALFGLILVLAIAPGIKAVAFPISKMESKRPPPHSGD